MARLISYMFTSLDGFIADRDGGLDWAPVDDELQRFANGSFAEMDGIVFGRTIHSIFVDYWDHLDEIAPGSPALEVEFARIFADMDRIVVSTTAEEGAARTTVVRDDVVRAIADVKANAQRDLLLICGPELRSTLAEARLVDRFRTLVAPVALGDGVPLFAAGRDPLALRLVEQTRFTGGVVMLDHEPA
jgi:dihydrofolate reductase